MFKISTHANGVPRSTYLRKHDLVACPLIDMNGIILESSTDMEGNVEFETNDKFLKHKLSHKLVHSINLWERKNQILEGLSLENGWN